jgi:hypothetical protein
MSPTDAGPSHAAQRAAEISAAARATHAELTRACADLTASPTWPEAFVWAVAIVCGAFLLWRFFGHDRW